MGKDREEVEEAKTKDKVEEERASQKETSNSRPRLPGTGAGGGTPRRERFGEKQETKLAGPREKKGEERT